MISPLLFGREGAEASLRDCQHKPPPRWFKHWWNSRSARVSLAASKAKKLCNKSAKNCHPQNMKKCQLNNNNVVYWFLITEHTRVPPAPLPPTPTVCLSVHLSASIPHFFSFAPLVSFSLSLHLSMCVCLSPVLLLYFTLSVLTVSSCKYPAKTTAVPYSHSVSSSLPPLPAPVLVPVGVSRRWQTAGVPRFTGGFDLCWRSRRAAADRWQSLSGQLTVIQG